MENQSELNWYEKLSAKVDSKGFKFALWTTIFVLIGGLVEIPPLFMQGAVKKIDKVTPYNALELAGRDIYQKEGCFNCHTQMIRPFKWETDRFGGKQYGAEPYSKAGEFVYDHPFLWGSKRIGPDLAHEAAIRPSAEWQKQHLIDPRSKVEGSIMPAYPWLFENKLDPAEVRSHMEALRTLGVPYSDADLAAVESLTAGKTEGDALVAYMLKLGRDLMVK